ncbi:MAG: STAS-like domain-containing protein [Hormoscilla sp. GM102CHS1]|nr:STAS-like domain-containing protein [Hormoscilla sp. GM102CHS1]
MNILTAPQTKTENAVEIVVTEEIGDTICIASEDGQKVYDRIAAAFQVGKKVIVSFKDAEDITTAFLAEAIAQLYHVFPEEQVESSLRVVDMEEIDAIDLEDAIYWTKEYIKDPERYIAAAKEAFGDYFFD